MRNHINVVNISDNELERNTGGKKGELRMSDKHEYIYWIPIKFPSLNTYVNECRKNRYAGASLKKEIEEDIEQYIQNMPKFNCPIKLDFHWVEKNKRRDYDNVAFAKKFVLDAMQKYDKLENDNRKYVVGFTDSFEVGEKWGLLLTITELDDNFGLFAPLT